MKTTDLGDAGERIAAARLCTATRGQFTNASLFAERFHLDGQFQFGSPHEHAFRLIPVQVKTGDQGKLASGRLRIDGIDREHVEHWRKSQLPTLLVWVSKTPRASSYWRLITKDTPLDTLTISPDRFISPATLYDLEHQFMAATSDRYPTMQLSKYPQYSLQLARDKAKAFYKNTPEIVSPIVGRVRLSKHGWRHINRWTKSVTKILDSLLLLPFLPLILSKPTRDVEICTKARQRAGKFVWEDRCVELKYKNVLFGADGYCTVHARFLERIAYPANWETATNLLDSVTRSAILESAYRKSEE